MQVCHKYDNSNSKLTVLQHNSSLSVHTSNRATQRKRQSPYLQSSLPFEAQMKFPFFRLRRLSQQSKLHLKTRTRCIILALVTYFIFCFIIIYVPDPNNARALQSTYNTSFLHTGAFQTQNENKVTPQPPPLFGATFDTSLTKEQLYIIENSEKCQSGLSNRKIQKRILVFVNSKPENFIARETIRKTWGNETSIHEYAVTLLFTMGVNNFESNAALIAKLREENDNSRDLVVGNFNDSYRSLTSKTKMNFHWFVSNCGQADFVVKTDDDVYLSYKNLYKSIISLPPVSLFGYCTPNRTYVSRDPREKSYIPFFDWEEATVPRYCFGIGYGMDNLVAKVVYQMSTKIAQFPLEDVFVGIAIEASRLVVNFKSFNDRFAIHANQRPFGLDYCNRKESVVFHQLTPNDIQSVFNEFKLAEKDPNFCENDLEKYKMSRYQTSL